MNKKERRNIRVRAIQTLYNMELLDITLDEALKDASDVINEDVKKLLVGVINADTSLNIPDFRSDEIIEKNLVNYTLDRLGFVDRSIIRVSTLEMLEGLSPSIAIDEALEITKMFSDNGDGKAKAFNNKLLDNISKYLGV